MVRRLDDVLEHVRKHAADVLVGHAVVDDPDQSFADCPFLEIGCLVAGRACEAS